MVHKQDLPSILLGLGNTATSIAATLKANGVQGARNTLRHLNPLVRYVELQLPLDEYELSVEQPQVDSVMTLRLTLPDGKMEETVITGCIKEFLEAFNRGEFPELELPQKRT
jgi:hypothetical protein